MQHVIELDSEEIKKIVSEYLTKKFEHTWSVKLLTSDGDDSMVTIKARAERQEKA